MDTLQSIFENKIKSDIDENGESDISVRSYSDRGMYGRNCLGVVTSSSIGELFSIILESFIDSRKVIATVHDIREARDAFQELRQDSMGMKTVYYFPNIQYSESEEDDDEHEFDEE